MKILVLVEPDETIMLTHSECKKYVDIVVYQSRILKTFSYRIVSLFPHEIRPTSCTLQALVLMRITNIFEYIRRSKQLSRAKNL